MPGSVPRLKPSEITDLRKSIKGRLKDPARVRAAYPGLAWDRLVEIKR